MVIQYIHHVTAHLCRCLSTATGPGVTWLQATQVQSAEASSYAMDTFVPPVDAWVGWVGGGQAVWGDEGAGEER